MFSTRFRMWQWAVLTVILFVLAIIAQREFSGTLLAVSLYKAHLAVLGGWVGYWLDRALFPYDRPHEYITGEPPPDAEVLDVVEVASDTYGTAMLRRAIIVAACLLCMGLGA